MNPDDLLEELRSVASTAGISALGVTDTQPFTEARRVIESQKSDGLHGGMHFTYGRPERSTDPALIVPGGTSIIVGLWAYGRDHHAPSHSPPAGRVARYVHTDAYGGLSVALGAVADRLKVEGHAAEVVLDDNRLVDRSAAYRAGLGWLGHNTNLLNPTLGSWVVIGSVVTSAELPRSESLVSDGCGSCRRCAAQCPTGALDEPGVLDARRCLAWLVQAGGSFPREFRSALGDRIYGCDDCQEVCPVNPALATASAVRVELKPRAPWVPLIDVLEASDEELLATFGHWYIPRRRAQYLRRNALVALGNVGEPDDPSVISALRSALGSSSVVERSHAVWAARRLGLVELLDDVTNDEAPEVHEELQATVLVRGDLAGHGREP